MSAVRVSRAGQAGKAAGSLFRHGCLRVGWVMTVGLTALP
jgi:hypothetical protein